MTLQRKLAMERAEGYAEGLELGKIEVLLVCVRNGYMTIDRAADELGKTVEEVQAMLAEVKEPHNLVQAFPNETKHSTTFATDARVMENGQVTIPKNVRAALGVESGDRVTFIVDGNNVSIVNSAVYALMRLQEQMAGEAEKAGLFTEEDVANWIAQSRREEITEWK